MPSIGILIQRKDAPPVLKEIPDEALVHVRDAPWTLALVEEGMGSGLPSIGLSVPLPDGRVFLAENSLSNLIMAVAAARGAFPDAFRGGVFDPDISDALMAQSERIAGVLLMLGDILATPQEKRRWGTDAQDVFERLARALGGAEPIVNPLQARVDRAVAILEDVDKRDGPTGKADHQTTVIQRAWSVLLGRDPDA